MEEQFILPKVRLKLEEGAKGEVKVSVAIDGDNEDEIMARIINTYKAIKKELEVSNG